MNEGILRNKRIKYQGWRWWWGDGIPSSKAPKQKGEGKRSEKGKKQQHKKLNYFPFLFQEQQQWKGKGMMKVWEVCARGRAKEKTKKGIKDLSKWGNHRTESIKEEGITKQQQSQKTGKIKRMNEQGIRN